jgi:uncharacterized radical SAM superfamily Fe-S cluster-containing enzyme
MLVSHDGSIWLRRFCAEHGETESLYEEDAELWRARHGWSTPTLHITPDRATNFGAFPRCVSRWTSGFARTAHLYTGSQHNRPL